MTGPGLQARGNASRAMPARLYTIGISHYCEKARWALDWHHLPFEEVGWPPGLHLRLIRRLGTPRSSLPILHVGALGATPARRSRGGNTRSPLAASASDTPELRGRPCVMEDTLIQGSDRIIDWAERQADTSGSPSLTPTADVEAGARIERRADDVLGVHVRRLFYAEVLPHHPRLVKPWLMLNASPGNRLMANLTWPLVRRLMIRGMDTAPEAAPDSRAKLEAELDRLDGLLADGRRFLAGERFSRVDLTVAALLAPFARPAQAPVYCAVSLPPALQQDVDRWRSRPIMRWVTETYAHYRLPVDSRGGGSTTRHRHHSGEQT